MTSESYSFKLKSHPDKLLVDHLQNVGTLCRKTISEKVLNMDDADLLTDAAYIIGVTHDLAKGTNFFQEYITETDEKRKKSLKARENTHHGLLSAFFTYAVIKDYLSQSGRIGGLADYLPIISFLAVKRHHGNLSNTLDEISEVHAEREKILKTAEEQINSMDLAEIEEILSSLLTGDMSDLKIDVNALRNYILNSASKDIGRKDKRFIRSLGSKGDLYPYFVTQFLYSALLDADKTDAGLDGVNLKRLDLAEDLVDRYRDAHHFSTNQENINSLRNQIYEDAIESITAWNLDDKILSLNVPTGTGKTLASLSLALKLRERLNDERKFKPRVIYALPFLSIIDQNYGVFEDVLNPGGEGVDSRLLLKHHHLADVKYKTEENEFEVDKSRLLLEGWNSEIIVTTFWQLFNTLFSNRNRQLRKFNKLANSIIILDEVQAIPHQYWQLTHDALKLLCDKFNSYVIFITATQPLIFEEATGEIKEIAQKKEEYFRGLNRIELIPKIESALTLDEFKALLEEDLTEKKDKDFLVVLNTIGSAQEVYAFIQSLKLENTKGFFLSTNVIPKERLKRINEIRNSGSGETKEPTRKVIVSTQLIEAGVDIDADIVYRDFAPLDSINQVAGRCNRNSAKDDKGTVSIFILKDDKKEFYKYIYDPFLISNTLDILKPIKEPIKESEFLDLNNRYFKAVKRGMGDQDSKDNLDYIAGLAFKDLSKNFKLIEEDYPRVDVFVEINKEAAEIWRQYQDLQSEKDHIERTKRYLKIKKEFSEYVISVPEKFARSLVVENGDIGYISIHELANYYDGETGFKREKAGEGSLIF
ncbi:MAG: Crispr-associated helicase Cas3 [Methanothrix harundinacea]|jgi:CRISPR-associated endonuclease/helicase Cas3|uniref:Crispr-associated helicase Cas3 n=1 Tax=Methanothrix harundinacea TaxID=301375 RepID=A0A101FSD9_9EURY|nr:MAG: Crispr-associated helicase Cas3 [Methanothrix harundinacea]